MGFLLILLAQLSLQSMANYVFPNYYGDTKAHAASTILMMAVTFFCAAITKPLVVKYGKKELSIVGSAIAVVGFLLILFVRPSNVWVYVGFTLLVYLGLGIYTMVSWALITDVIDYSELKTGVREDGTVYAVYSFSRKLGQAASSGLTGGLLTMIGYTAATAFDPEVVNGIYNIAAIVPAAGFILVILVLWFWYPLDKKTGDANVAALKEKHGE